MTWNSFLILLAPIAVAGCISTHPVVLGADNPGNPDARSMQDQLASLTTLASYQAPSDFSAISAGKSGATGMGGMDHGSLGAMNNRTMGQDAGTGMAPGAKADGAAPPKGKPGEMKMAHAGHADAHGVGTVNSVDPATHKINVTHEPIPTIGWPSMTMDFPVSAKVDLKAVQPGARVNFTMEKGKSGMYEIQSIQPAAK